MDDTESVCTDDRHSALASLGHSRSAKQPSDWLAAAAEGPPSISLSELGVLRGLRMEVGPEVGFFSQAQAKLNSKFNATCRVSF